MTKDELTDEKIGHLIDSKTYDAISWFSSKLSTEREKVLDYVNRKLPKPFFNNGSRWVSPVVYNHVEFMRAQIGDTFSAGSGLITFQALHPQDIEAARIASEYVNHCFFSLNNGEKFIRDAVFDGLTARNAVAKVSWEKDYDYEVLEFENVSQEELDAWTDDENITDLHVAQAENGSYMGKLVKRQDKGKPVVELINPEEFAIERSAKSLSPEYFMVHRTSKTLDWVITQWPELKGREDELRTTTDRATDLSLTPEALARHEATDYGYERPGTEVQDELAQITLIEAYSQFKRKGDLTARLYRVIRAGSVNIAIEPCEELPFVCFTPIPRPHVWYGENYAKTLMPTQDMHTAAYRLIADSAMLSNTPRFLVEKGALVDPRSLLDARLGGVIQVKNMGGVMPMPQPAMNPMLFNLVQGLEAQIEATSGISQASVGLSKEALSSRSSASMMESITGMSMIRQKEIARNFATQFLCPIFEKIYNLVVRYENREKIIELAGNWVTVNPTTWAEKRIAVPAIHLGYGERAAHAQKIMEFGITLKNNGGDMFAGPEGFYNMLTDAMTLEGHRVDIQRYLPITPDKLQPPQPSPREVAEVAVMQADAESKMILAQTQAKKVAEHGEITALKARLAAIESHYAQMIREQDAHRKDVDVANRVNIAQREMALLEQEANRAGAEAQTRNIVSP